MFERVHSYDFNVPMDLWAVLSTHLCMHINLRRYNCTWIVTSIKTSYGDVQDTLKTRLQTTASEWFVCTSPISPSCLQVKVRLYMAADVLDTELCTHSYRRRTFDSSFIFNSVLQISVHCIESGREGCANISLHLNRLAKLRGSLDCATGIISMVTNYHEVVITSWKCLVNRLFKKKKKKGVSIGWLLPSGHRQYAAFKEHYWTFYPFKNNVMYKFTCENTDLLFFASAHMHVNESRVWPGSYRQSLRC